MWFQDLVNGNWYHTSSVIYFFISPDAGKWDISFESNLIGVQVYQTGYLTKLLAQTALAALIATFTV